MDARKTYEDVENLIVLFFEGDEYEKQMALEEIISSFKPLIVKLMMKYFGRYDEDLMQDGIVELIQRTVDYDYKNYNKFCAYIKRFMIIFFRRLYFNQKQEFDVTNDEIFENDLSQNDNYDFEIDSVVATLDERQSHIIRANVLENKKLKLVADDMKISYIYAKKIKKSAIEELRKVI